MKITATVLEVEGRVEAVPRGRIGLIVLGSLLGGAVVAVVLAALAFGGAVEPVVAGGVLLAFAAAWASLGSGSRARMSRSHAPQRVNRSSVAALDAKNAAMSAIIDQRFASM